MDRVADSLTSLGDAFQGAIPVLSAIMIFLFVVGVVFVFVRAQLKGDLDFRDIITYDGPDSRVSLTKVLQMVGGITGTWIVIKLTLSGGLTWDIFVIYLSYVASIEGFSKFVRAKYNVKEDKKEKKDDTEE